MLTHPDPHLTHIYPHTPLDVPKHLSVSQYLPIVNMEHVASGGDHDVVVVAVPNAQHIGGHTVASTGGSEGLNSLGERGVGVGEVRVRDVEVRVRYVEVRVRCVEVRVITDE